MSSVKTEMEPCYISPSYEVMKKRAEDLLHAYEEAAIGGSSIEKRNELEQKVLECMLKPIRVLDTDLRSRLTKQVTEFHQKFGHAVRTMPTIPPDEEIRFRLKLIAEEFLELFDACGIFDGNIEAILKSMIEDAPIEIDLPEFQDAIRDLMYVLTGTEIVFGLPGDECGDEVHRANIQKDAVYVQTKDGYHKGQTIKPKKPEGWRPPDILGILIAQGYVPPDPDGENE